MSSSPSSRPASPPPTSSPSPAAPPGSRSRRRRVAAMATSREIVDDIERQGRPVYGVSTGFGALASTFIAPERRAELQHALIRSHAAGVGAPMPREVVRAMMLLRVRSLALGHSGVRPLVAAGARRPAQPRHHAVGAGARIARRLRRPRAAGPLRARAARRGLGARQGRRPGGRRRCAGARRAATDRPVVQGGPGAHQRHRRHARHAAAGDRRRRAPVRDGRRDRGAVDRGDARLGPAVRARDPRDPAASGPGGLGREHPPAAAELRRSWTATATTSSTPCRTRTRSGARRRSPARPGTRSTSSDQVAARELVSIVDNPVVLPDGRVVSTGNFHGAPLGFAADFLAIAAAEVGSISERRVDRLLDVTRSRDLPAFLTPGPGRQLRPDDRAVHRRRRSSPRTVASPSPGQRRLGADQRHAGGPRLDGLGGRAEAADRPGQPDQPARGRAARRRPRPAIAGTAGAVAAGRGRGRGGGPFAGAPGPDIFLAPVIEAARAAVAGPSLRAEIEAAIGPLA